MLPSKEIAAGRDVRLSEWDALMFPTGKSESTAAHGCRKIQNIHVKYNNKAKSWRNVCTNT